MRIELDSNLRNLPWTFRPLETVVDVHPAKYGRWCTRSPTRPSRPMTGQAIPSYGPQHAAKYFKKLECFCFAKQTLQPGEVRRMPVVFVVDPKAPGRPRTRLRCRTRFSKWKVRTVASERAVTPT